jgi:hypothetical protein
MEESGSEGLDDLVFSKKDTFLKVTTVYIYSDMGGDFFTSQKLQFSLYSSVLTMLAVMS